jgi:hypothetical protein
MEGSILDAYLQLADCCLTVIDFSQNSIEVTIERPDGLISHDLAAIKGDGRFLSLRDRPPSPPPHAG